MLHYAWLWSGQRWRSIKDTLLTRVLASNLSHPCINRFLPTSRYLISLDIEAVSTHSHLYCHIYRAIRLSNSDNRVAILLGQPFSGTAC